MRERNIDPSTARNALCPPHEKHLSISHNVGKTTYPCSTCGKSFSRKDNLTHHTRTCTNATPDIHLKRPYTLLNPDITFAKRRCIEYRIQSIDSGFHDAVHSYRITFDPEMQVTEIWNQLNGSINAMYDILNGYLIQKNALKFTCTVKLMFRKAVELDVMTDPPVCLSTQAFSLYFGSNVDETLDLAYKQLRSKIDTFETEGSGWVADRLVCLDTTLYELDPLRASSYHPLPEWIVKKKAIRNVKNMDQECGPYSHLYTNPPT